MVKGPLFRVNSHRHLQIEVPEIHASEVNLQDHLPNFMIIVVLTASKQDCI